MDFWQAHPGVVGVLFLLGMAFIPRITMLVAMATPFGLLAWLGWFFVPHLTVAIFATIMYWKTNPVLCIIAWFFAFGGTSAEGGVTVKASSKSSD